MGLAAARRVLTKKRAQLGTILTQSFPSVKAVVDPDLQMSREMALLRQATGASSVQNFESMLSCFWQFKYHMQPAYLITPTAIEYVANSMLTLKSMKLAANELTAAQEKLKPMGYTLTQNGDTASLKVQAAP